MRKNENKIHVYGRVYEHDLEIKTVKNEKSPNFGKPFIGGTLHIAVDEEGLNVIPVSFTYVAEKTKGGGVNKTYTELSKIINTGKTWVLAGKDEATKVKVDQSALSLNDFVASDDTMVSVMRAEGGFVEVVGSLPSEDVRTKFLVDMVITNIIEVEADASKGVEEHLKVRGAAFSFKGDLLPVEFKVINPEGIAYFNSLDVSPASPLYTSVWGIMKFVKIASTVVIESAFGGSSVDTSEKKVKDWILTGAGNLPYDFGEEGVLTVAEFTKAIQDREVMLAEKKRERAEYLATKATAAATPAPGFGNITPPSGPAGFTAPAGFMSNF